MLLFKVQTLSIIIISIRLLFVNIEYVRVCVTYYYYIGRVVKHVCFTTLAYCILD